MKIKELINELKKYDENVNVIVHPNNDISHLVDVLGVSPCICNGDVYSIRIISD